MPELQVSWEKSLKFKNSDDRLLEVAENQLFLSIWEFQHLYRDDKVVKGLSSSG